MSGNIKVAAVHAEPVWGDLQGSVKVVELILEAANEGTKVFGLPQLFVPGYPWTIWTPALFSTTWETPCPRFP